MSSYKNLKSESERFFNRRNPAEVTTFDMAKFTALNMSSRAIISLLSEIAQSKDLTELVSLSSYKVTPNFLKLLILRSENNWGIRIHSLNHSGNQPLIEPWHEHRWTLGSSVLAGNLTSDNGMCQELDTEGSSANEYYKYTVEDKRVTGKISPHLVGSCALNDRFRFKVSAGSSYSSHVDLAHRLVITEPTVTAVVTAPDASPTASFIEPEPLCYEERALQPTLEFDETKEILVSTIDIIKKNTKKRNDTPQQSPFPHLLTAVRN